MKEGETIGSREWHREQKLHLSGCLFDTEPYVEDLIMESEGPQQSQPLIGYNSSSI